MKHIKKWQEPFYAIGGFGPGFMYQLIITYLLYYYRPSEANLASGALVALAPAGGYALGMLVARILDGVVDIPIAGWTDNLRSKWGRRRPLMLLGIIPAVIFFILLWFPPITGAKLGVDGHWFNALYVAVISVFYFFFHTLLTVPYLASLSEIVTDENSRVRVASWQTVFNTMSYVLVFVVVPILFDKFGIRTAVLMLVPAFLTFIGPLLVIKENPTDGSAGQPAEKQVSLWDSFKQTLTNKTFLIYISAVATFYFGLQFFLGGLAFMADDMMHITKTQLGIMNAAAFAPIPIMLILFNLITKKWGAKAAFRAALLVFAVGMLLFPLGWTVLNLPIPPMVVGIIASGIGSFSIGAFFTIPYAFPSHIAAVDAEKTGKDRAGMFFAVQGVINQIMGALSGSALTLLLTWKTYGVVAIGPVVAVTMVLAYFLFAKYPLGQPASKAVVKE